jgi:hypothetical protein
VQSDDHRSWRHIYAFPTLKEANMRMAKLEQIPRVSQGEQG